MSIILDDRLDGAAGTGLAARRSNDGATYTPLGSGQVATLDGAGAAYSFTSGVFLADRTTTPGGSPPALRAWLRVRIADLSLQDSNVGVHLHDDGAGNFTWFRVTLDRGTATVQVLRFHDTGSIDYVINYVTSWTPGDYDVVLDEPTTAQFALRGGPLGGPLAALGSGSSNNPAGGMVGVHAAGTGTATGITLLDVSIQEAPFGQPADPGVATDPIPGLAPFIRRYGLRAG